MATTIIKTTFQLKRGSAAKWQELNLVLAAGEPGFEIDTNRLKIGNGNTPWLELPYINDGSIVNAATHFDFPIIGASGVIYKAQDEKMLYQWNSKLQSYEILGLNSNEGTGIIVDTELSDSSLNAIANSTVTKALRSLEEKLTFPSFDFGEGLKVEEINGIQTVSVDLSNLYTKNEVYNKTEIDLIVGNLTSKTETVQTALDAYKVAADKELYGNDIVSSWMTELGYEPQYENQNSRIDLLDLATNKINTILTGFGGEGEPATVLEAIITGGQQLPVATTDTIGGIKSAEELVDNAVSVSADGIAAINRINVNTLVQSDGEELVLAGGQA